MNYKKFEAMMNAILFKVAVIMMIVSVAYWVILLFNVSENRRKNHSTTIVQASEKPNSNIISGIIKDVKISCGDAERFENYIYVHGITVVYFENGKVLCLKDIRPDIVFEIGKYTDVEYSLDNGRLVDIKIYNDHQKLEKE